MIWTRGRWEPDLTPTIRGWFDESGFDEVSFTAPDDVGWSVGVHRLCEGRAEPFTPGVRMFAFRE